MSFQYVRKDENAINYTVNFEKVDKLEDSSDQNSGGLVKRIPSKPVRILSTHNKVRGE